MTSTSHTVAKAWSASSTSAATISTPMVDWTDTIGWWNIANLGNGRFGYPLNRAEEDINWIVITISECPGRIMVIGEVGKPTHINKYKDPVRVAIETIEINRGCFKLETVYGAIVSRGKHPRDLEWDCDDGSSSSTGSKAVTRGSTATDSKLFDKLVRAAKIINDYGEAHDINDINEIKKNAESHDLNVDKLAMAGAANNGDLSGACDILKIINKLNKMPDLNGVEWDVKYPMDGNKRRYNTDGETYAILYDKAKYKIEEDLDLDLPSKKWEKRWPYSIIISEHNFPKKRVRVVAWHAPSDSPANQKARSADFNALTQVLSEQAKNDNKRTDSCLLTLLIGDLNLKKHADKLRLLNFDDALARLEKDLECTSLRSTLKNDASIDLDAFNEDDITNDGGIGGNGRNKKKKRRIEYNNNEGKGTESLLGNDDDDDGDGDFIDSGEPPVSELKGGKQFLMNPFDTAILIGAAQYERDISIDINAHAIHMKLVSGEYDSEESSVAATTHPSAGDIESKWDVKDEVRIECLLRAARKISDHLPITVTFNKGGLNMDADTEDVDMLTTPRRGSTPTSSLTDSGEQQTRMKAPPTVGKKRTAKGTRKPTS